MRFGTILLSSIFTLLCGAALSAPTQGSGYVQNVDGAKCWYDQTIKRMTFLHSIPANTAVMTFRDPSCMRAEGTAKTVNIMMINNLIGRWYNQSDVDFMTHFEDLMKTSALQKKGVCMQSKRYPNRAVAIFYDIQNGKFTRVLHAMAVQGCK